jgi:RimJ/RimL family protein N-acetyltransferase
LPICAIGGILNEHLSRNGTTCKLEGWKMYRLLLSLPEQLETERLTLRPYRSGDGGAYLDVCLRNKAHLLPYEAGNPALGVHSIEDAESLVRQFAIDWMSRQSFFLGGWQRASNHFIAQIYIGPVSWDLPEFELGYFVDCRHEGQGFGTEALRASLDFCFEHLRAHRLRLSCNETNVRSWRVAERCGFKREGHIRQVHPDILRDDGTFSGDYIYGLLRSEHVQA